MRLKGETGIVRKKKTNEWSRLDLITVKQAESDRRRRGERKEWLRQTVSEKT